MTSFVIKPKACLAIFVIRLVLLKVVTLGDTCWNLLENNCMIECWVREKLESLPISLLLTVEWTVLNFDLKIQVVSNSLWKDLSLMVVLVILSTKPMNRCIRRSMHDMSKPTSKKNCSRIPSMWALENMICPNKHE